ncbi:MAG: dephospho-CoA kinase [Planctomycetota bacterium]|jgi:dephospho-CoA kinase
MTPSPSPEAHATRGTTVLGVLGGIASGKSTVARALAGPQGVILDADRVAHDALQSEEVRALVVARHGDGVLDAAGAVDRAALGAIVFADRDARTELEGWIHPRVRATLHASLEDAAARGVPRVVLDVPLLLENAEEHGLLELCDHLVFVDAPADARDRRAVRDRGWEPGEVARREAAQMPLSTKRSRADVVVVNDGDLDSVIERTTLALRELTGA